MKTLVLGGVRSGKSNYAEQLVLNSQLQAVYIATATAGDPEMADRILKHQQQRGSHWQNIEEPVKLLDTLQSSVNHKSYVLVDCLTLWLSNLLLIDYPESQDKIVAIEKKIHGLCQLIKTLDGDVVFVSNEVGLGIVPMGELSRQFCDLAGVLHQQLAAQCDRVILMVAGIPQIIKNE
ncbi:Adenosylcobinamide kinase / Adenosylcobinamide-phosphate guanylyltransferase [hydrothermal vent metagenome]|uniref:Adenosylcobinamide kinase n=1 Tax=hydrothermal vent metagenome TaxID=652676 RepID=A0A3B1AWN1_9ZZZZ